MKSWLVAIGGVFLILLLLGFVLRSTNSARDHVPGGTASGPAQTAANEGYHDILNGPLMIGSVSMQVRYMGVSKVDLFNLGKPDVSSEELLKIAVGLTNTSAKQELQYQPWGPRTNRDPDLEPHCRDDAGNRYDLKAWRLGVEVPGQVKTALLLTYNQPVVDVLFFERPARTAKTLLLDFPAKNIGGHGTIKISMHLQY